MRTRFKIRKSKKDGKFYWHAIRNGRVVADGGEGYARRAGLRKSLKAFLGSIMDAKFDLIDE